MFSGDETIGPEVFTQAVEVNRRKIKAVLAVISVYLGLHLGWANAGSLEDAEAFRPGSEAVRIVAEVALYEQEKLSKTRTYHVYAGNSNRTLVLFKSSAEAGQKVLMKGNNFWMFMPKSRRPIRITPMQKLLGEASLGDVATMNWSKAYEIVSERRDGEKLHLKLKAKQKSTSYQVIELRLAAKDSFPLSADLYLHSGMLAKTATYQRGLRDGKAAVVAMQLFDRMRSGSRTLIHYRRVEPAQIPDKLFNPQILLRGNLEQLLRGVEL